MKKNLLLSLVFAFYASLSWSQNYKIESTVGGVGSIGEKVTTDSYEYFVKNQSIYFIDNKTEKMIIEVDQQGIIKNKYQFAIFSNAIDNATSNVMSNILVDQEDRFIIYCSRNNNIYCFKKDGTLIYNTSIETYINGGFYASFATDSKNNLYIGGKELISVLDKTGKFLYNFGKKGTNDGEFTGNISQIIVDDKDNLFVRNNVRMQQLDVQGKYLSKFDCPYEYGIAYDGKDNFYVADKDYSTVIVLDKKGTSLSKTSFGSFSVNIYDIIGVMNGNPIVYVNKFSRSTFTIFDKSGKVINNINKRTFDDGGIGQLNDFQFDANDNLWVVDWDKAQMFNNNLKFVKKIAEGNSFDFSNIEPLLSINSKSDAIYFNSSDKQIYNSNLEKSIKNTLVTFPTKESLSFVEIDSVKKEIITLATPFSGTSSINIFDFDGKLKRTLLKQSDMVAMTRGKDGNLYVLSQTSSKYVLTIYDENGKVISSFQTGIGQFGDSPMGITLDEYGIIHFAIRHIYGGQGFAIYGFDKKGKLQTSRLNISDGKGNFTSNNSYLLKYHKGSLYLGDFIGNQIFKIKYSPSGNALKEAALIISDITKIIDDKEFTLAPTSNSKGAITYTLTSGDAVSVSNVGLIKILKNGIAKVKISQAETTEYLAAEQTITITVKLLTAQITQIAAVTKTVSDTDFDLKPVSNSDGKISFKVLSGDAVSVNTTGTVKIVRAGKATIQISQTESVKYEATTSTVDVTVNKLTQTITFEKLPIQIQTNSSGVSLKATTNGSLPVTFKVISGPASISNNMLKPTGIPGSVVVEATQIGDDKYDVASAIRQTVEAITVLANSLEEENGTVIYPNPTHEFLYVKSDKLFNSFQIISMNGTILNQNQYQKNAPINVSGLRNGAYLIKLIDKNQEFQTIKFVIE